VQPCTKERPNLSHRHCVITEDDRAFIRGLFSHLLARMTRRLSDDWQRLYGHPIHFVETFIARSASAVPATGQPTERCWARPRGKDAPTSAPNRSIKQVRGWHWCPTSASG
jgi:hypothetical protein